MKRNILGIVLFLAVS